MSHNEMLHQYCPKCKENLYFHLTKHDDGKHELSMFCNNQIIPNCNFKKVLTTDIISDQDRHMIIENYFGYSVPSYFTKDHWENTILNYLLFSDTKEFIHWLFQQIEQPKKLDHHNTNISVGSPYPFLISQLSKFLYNNYRNDFVEQLKWEIKTKLRIDYYFNLYENETD
jgi:hypothetical protein